MSVAITDVDTFTFNIDDGVVDTNVRKYATDFGNIDGDILPLWWDKRPVSLGRGQYQLDYNDTTVDGGNPSSAAELKAMLQDLIMNI